ncbi:sodium- and chloride-dependent glycine transporter 2 [Lingula anatina]|uniref:Transporter n=1 Tax=Lingula anatina TaxID=7574 RepID=A0A1S3H181_LINAN|nr:sodium- and chloride-dependent glycine transporter 2 [Lingula anatina]|eukprot:XP_013379895.1 sodium- and chloride-dependent glycine transporter 2 [Lingula anatina]
MPSFDKLRLTLSSCASCGKGKNQSDASADTNENLRHNGKLEKVDSEESEGDENKERGNWTRQLDFFLSCVGYAVGLGNLWRFPYVCMRNGGGAFLIPYFLFLFLCGIPLFFMELSVAQFSSSSPLSLWRICPLFKGIGFGMVLVSAVFCIYYNVIMAWVFYYLAMSFAADVPWGTCGNWWNTENCVSKDRKLNVTYALANCTNSYLNSSLDFMAYQVEENETLVINEEFYWNSTCNNTMIEPKGVSSTEEFWLYNLLDISPGIEDLRGIKWQLLICLIVAWIITVLCVVKGVKSSGKVVYVTATVPYGFLVILMIRGLLLPGAIDGIKYYVTPNFQKLTELNVWCEACLQIFYSLGPAWGGLITMAGYNRFHNNMYRDAIIIPLVNCFTSFFAGFVIFSVIGFMAKESNTPIDQLGIQSGPGLAFVAYPEAIARLPISPLWAIMFFLMLLTLGLDTQFATLETLTSSFVDEFAQFLRKRKMLFTTFVCLIEFGLGLPCVTRGGVYVFQIMDWYSAAFAVVTMGLSEVLIIAWIYGGNRLYDDIEMMIGYKPNIIWQICWRFLTPVLLFIAFVLTVRDYKAPFYGTYSYPPSAIQFGWFLASVPLIPIPIVAVYQIYKTPGPFTQRIRTLLRPSEDWGPAVAKYRASYKYRCDAVRVPTQEPDQEDPVFEESKEPLDDTDDSKV